MINYERRGRGEPLVLIHGIGHRWQAWLPVLPRLARHHEVFAIDLPGFGESPVPPDGPAHHVAQLVMAVRRELAALDLHRPHVVGNSLGGAVALELAAAGTVASATAFSPAGFYDVSEGPRGFLMLNLNRMVTFVPDPVLRWGVSQPWIRRAGLRNLVADPTRLNRDRVLGDSRALRRGKGFLPLAWGLRDYSFTGTPPPDVPVTIAWGSRDRILGPWQADRARQRLPQARHVELPRCGHVPMSDDPAAVVRTILATTGAPFVRNRASARA